ncbi:GNAT family N-acetyltransferase [Streptomyces sp. GC420]|uniref:GNAT family N-acetyltransferase n=1 Tax=Streptomyces sp. GC420 TaxID=2697568 RepID=UPI001414D5DB|nr:GNAT family N-acetyltransferase [Streptomyces sp. GC420]NBM17332.1 GNAT family N-acetyltransferase [Streptomyces sp. GC420]
MGQHVVRAVRAGEWRKVRELRLAALEDPAAPIAFLETVQQAAELPEASWRARTERGAGGTAARQFIAETADGAWVGSVTLLVEEAGGVDYFGNEVRQPQAQAVGVYVRPEHRGTGLAEELFRAALDWAWALEDPRLERVRLFVHERNGRAEALYRKAGFIRTGVAVPMVGDPAAKEYELAVGRPSR